MRELPILMDGEMVRAILDGRKSQTRRPVYGAPPNTDPSTDWAWFNDGRFWYAYDGEYPDEGHYDKYNSPFGCSGDLLYVRHAWAVNACFDNLVPREIAECYGGILVWGRVDNTSHDEENDKHIGKWRPSIHMPKAFARTWLLVERVWVERVQEITPEDAQKEGIHKFMRDHNLGGYWTTSFARLWDSIYAKQGLGWEQDPWVWACQFKRISLEQVEEMRRAG